MDDNGTSIPSASAESVALYIGAMTQELGQMAYPGTDLVVPRSFDVHGSAAKALNPVSPFWRQGMAGKFGEQPHSVGEELSVGVGGAAYFFACHGVSGKKAGLAGGAEKGECSRRNGHLDAANIGYQLMGLEMGR